MRIHRLALPMVLLAGLCMLRAQNPKPKEEFSTRSVEGVVTDASKAPVVGAVVLMEDTKTLQIRSFITDKDGRYHFTGLSTSADYELRAQYNGVNSPTKRLNVYNTHPTATVNLQLKKK